MTLCLLSALILLTACNMDDGILSDCAQNPSLAERLANADSLFLNLSIVSSTQTTRAFEDGSPAENAVYDGILAIFEGNSETNATLKNATVIDQLINNPNEPRPTILSSSSSIDVVQRLPIGTHAYPSSGKLYALVLLNSTSTGFTVSNNMLYLNGTSLDGKTRAEIQAMPISSVGNTDEHTGLFMMNKPKDGGQLVIQVYDPSWTDRCYLYDSEEAITQSPYEDNKKKLTINVERAAARIKLTNDIPASKALSNIHLNAVPTAHPLIHKITWTLASELPGNTEATGANIFSLFHQHSHESGEAVYVPETSSSTQIIVEVQLKDESNVLLGDCYSFPTLSGNNLYTNVDELIAFYKSGWDGWPYQRNNYPDLSTWSADDVFRNTKVTMLDNYKIKVSLLTDETIATVGNAQRTALKDLENVLSDLTQGYRDGKMYYTYSVSSVQHNNAYNLSLVELGNTDTHYVAVTFNYQNGQGWVASFSNNSSNLFATNRVVTGSNMNYNGWDTNFGQAKYNPTSEHSSPTADDKIDFLLDPEEGWTFTPSRVAFNTTRYGTDGGNIDVYWLNSGLATNVSLDTGVVPPRNNQPVNVLSWNKSSFTAGAVGGGECGLRLLLYKLKNDKQVGFSDIVISGTLTKTSTESTQKSISGVGRANP